MNKTISKHSLKLVFWLAAIVLITFPAYAQKVVEPQNPPADWSREYPPFRIVGNLYYVGTYDLACYLITTTQGNILINTGLASSEQVIKKNIETLGFKYTDTKILLITQAHYDHTGALAAIQKATGAELLVDAKDADVMADGGISDYAFGTSISNFEPIKATRLLNNGDVIKKGDMQLTLLHHPGHTKGSCSYLFDVRDDSKSYKVLIANLPTIVTDKSFYDLPAYPEIAKDYANTLTALKNLQFDIWLASHAGQFGLHAKHKPGDAYNPAVFIDRKGYDEAVDKLQTAFNNKIEKSK